jgi:hypothetical protein
MMFLKGKSNKKSIWEEAVIAVFLHEETEHGFQ